MVDIVASSAFKVAHSLRQVSPHFADHIEECAKAKIQNGWLIEALQEIVGLKPDAEFGAVPIETAQKIAKDALERKS